MSKTEQELSEPAAAKPSQVAAVVIGRNEGGRLAACLASLVGHAGQVVYVDSGSSDGSIDLARAAGARVVALEADRPFTAARARNAGMAALAESALPDYVQFLDGDCVLQPGWLGKAACFLDERQDVALVCGRRRERHPGASVYNQLCDWEWDTPVGRTDSCGGDALVRASAFQAVDGYRADLIAGEEPELCQRLRGAGWHLCRLEEEMTLHDADMHRFSQWWRRGVRTGHAFAEVGWLHRGGYRVDRRRIWFWGAGLPSAVLAGAIAGGASVALPLATMLYALSWARVAARFKRWGMGPRRAVQCGGLITLSKFCNLQGMLLFHWRRVRGRRAGLIEYK